MRVTMADGSYVDYSTTGFIFYIVWKSTARSVTIFSKPSMRNEYHHINVLNNYTKNCTLSIQPNLPYM